MRLLLQFAVFVQETGTLFCGTTLNCLEGITISITGDIEELSKQEYRGKRVYVTLEDDTEHAFLSKIDFGVHKQVQIEQDEYCFDVCLDEVGASLLIMSE